MDFSEALRKLKQGKRVERSGWNGKGMWLLLISDDEWGFVLRIRNKFPAGKGFTAVTPFIAMKTADDMMVPWLASQTDILAEDWEVVE